jgi:hypothetical protein
VADMASELEALAFRLRRAGEQDLARELARAMRDAVGPVPGKIRGGLKPRLPDRYAGTLGADLDIKTISRNSGSATADAAESVYAQTRSGGKGRKLRRLDAGLLTHPLFGDREHWYTQAGTSQGVTPGWFTVPASIAAPRIRAELERALRDVAAKAAGKGA